MRPRSLRRPAAALAALLASVLATGTTSAAETCRPASGLSTCIAADNLWPYPAAGPWTSLYPTTTTPAGMVQLGLELSYLSRPIGLRVSSPDPAGTTSYAVDDVLDSTFLLALGVTERLQLSVAVPVVLFQTGSGVSSVTGSSDTLPRSAVGDLRFGVGVALLPRPAAEDGFALTGHFELGTPTGDRSAFITSGTAVYLPGLALQHRIGRFEWGVDAGARIRGSRVLAGASIGSQLSAAAGASVDILADGWLSANLETSWLFTLDEQQRLAWSSAASARVPEPTGVPHIPAEWLLGVRSAGLLDEQLQLSLGGGSFIPTAADSAVTVPRFRFLFGVRYVPAASGE
jgi:OmpA-OmpF porin, OOP family